MLVDDRSSAVSLPEVPLLGVLPGTGGLTRVTDKRKVRHDLADIFCTTSRRRARPSAPRSGGWSTTSPSRSSSPKRVQARVERCRAQRRARPAPRASLTPLSGASTTTAITTSTSTCRSTARAHGHAHRARRPPPQASDIAGDRGAAGASWWPLAMARELDDAILSLRTNELDIGTWLLKTAATPDAVLACDATLAHRDHWFVRETIGLLRRTLAASTCPSRSCSRCDRARLVLRRHAARAGAGLRPQLHAGAARRADDAAPRDRAVAANFGLYPMVTGSRGCRRRFYEERDALEAVRATVGQPLRAEQALRWAWSPRPGRHRLGRRDRAWRSRSARDVARRAHRHGSQPALQRPGDHGDARLRPPVGLAELDLQPPQRGRRQGRAEGVRHRRRRRNSTGTASDTCGTLET